MLAPNISEEQHRNVTNKFPHVIFIRFHNINYCHTILCSLILQVTDHFFPFLVKTVIENLELSTHEFVNKFRRLKPSPYTEIIFTCRSGKRAEDACEMARNLGYKM